MSKLYGSYLNFIEFDQERYWDIRENVDIRCYPVPQLPSSSVFREDRVFLQEKKMDEAQVAKEKLENIQRNDRKLREGVLKKNGKK